MRFIAFPGQAYESLSLGGKARGLAALAESGLPIPAWFVLLPEAFEASLDEQQRQALKENHLPEIVDSLATLRLAPEAQAELAQALDELELEGRQVAVRSSALDEDGVSYSFAGQLESFLEVDPAQAAESVIAVWRSAFSERVLAYRREHGLGLKLSPPAALIQRMVNATAAGVAFSADPVTGQRDTAVVAAVPGLGQALVSGATDADTYYIDRQERIIRRDLAPKPAGQAAGKSQPVTGYTGYNGNHAQTPAYPEPALATLTDRQVLAVAGLVRQVAQLLGTPQDIEWALEGDQLYLLQARPITGLPEAPPNSPPPAETGGALNLWDNSNIAESYPGVTTPLTFSFARRAYEEVYRQFCRIMGVPAHTIASHALTFRHMLGFIQGRVYYNLLSWYQVLALLPGYKLNRRFMEQMMGVKERLPDELLDLQRPASRGDRWKDALYLLRTLAGLVLNYLFLPRRIGAFYARLNQALGPNRPDLSRQRPDELVAYYRRLEQQLLPHWDAPLINDFFAMIFYGLLRKLAESWCGDTEGSLPNKLLFGNGGIISAEPAQRIAQMAGLAEAGQGFIKTLAEGSLAEIMAHMAGLPDFEAQYRAYLERFGERCLEELKLESPTLHDDPLPLLRGVGQLAQNREMVEARRLALNASPRDQAKTQVDAALAGRPLRAWLFHWVLENARRLIRNRENLRFERTRLFGRARMIFVELGRRFQASGWLAEPRDIFYLEVGEVLGLVEGTTSTTDLQSLVAVRRAEFERYGTLPPLPNRFETRGIPYQKFRGKPAEVLESPGVLSRPDKLQGLGCSPGVVRGPVRLVSNPKDVQLGRGEILVAERTDPGWITLFPAAAGLLVEYGSLLSHSAIVSRELGLPAIVSLSGITGWLKDGDWVEFDGSTGLVTRVERPDE